MFRAQEEGDRFLFDVGVGFAEGGGEVKGYDGETGVVGCTTTAGFSFSSFGGVADGRREGMDAGFAVDVAYAFVPSGGFESVAQ